MSEKMEMDVISYLSNPLVRSAVKRIASKLNPSTPMVEMLRDYYLDLHPNYVPEDGAITAHLHGKGCTEKEIALAISKKELYAKVQKDGAGSLVNYFYFYYKRQKLREATEIFEKNRLEDYETALSEFLEETSRITKMGGTVEESVCLADMDAEELFGDDADGLEARIPSKFQVVRQSAFCESYQKGQLIHVVAPSGRGKSLIMLNEAVFLAQQGYKIVWADLGDMTKKMVGRRIACLVNKITPKELNENPKKWLTPEVRDVLANIHFYFFPPNEVTASALVNTILNREDHYDVVVLDYDDNLAPEYDNMYLEGGNSYKEFLRIARKENDYKLVFAASQVKNEFQEVEVLPINCVAQSNAKKNRVHMMIAVNRNDKNPNIGTINIPKQRDGIALKTYYVLEPTGNFKGISREEYNELLNNRDMVEVIETDESQPVHDTPQIGAIVG